MVKDNLAETLKWERKKRGMSLSDVAEAVEITIRRAFSYESGESEPDLDVLVAYAEFYGTTVDDLLGRKSTSHSEADGTHISLAKFGERLRQFRIEKKLSAKQIAEEAGITRQYLSSIESGAKIPSFETGVNLMKALGVAPNFALMDILPAAYSHKARYLESRTSILNHVNQSLLLNLYENVLNALINAEKSQAVAKINDQDIPT